MEGEAQQRRPPFHRLHRCPRGKIKVAIPRDNIHYFLINRPGQPVQHPVGKTNKPAVQPPALPQLGTIPGYIIPMIVSGALIHHLSQTKSGNKSGIQAAARRCLNLPRGIARQRNIIPAKPPSHPQRNQARLHLPRFNVKPVEKPPEMPHHARPRRDTHPHADDVTRRDTPGKKPRCNIRANPDIHIVTIAIGRDSGLQGLHVLPLRRKPKQRCHPAADPVGAHQPPAAHRAVAADSKPIGRPLYPGGLPGTAELRPGRHRPLRDIPVKSTAVDSQRMRPVTADMQRVPARGMDHGAGYLLPDHVVVHAGKVEHAGRDQPGAANRLAHPGMLLEHDGAKAAPGEQPCSGTADRTSSDDRHIVTHQV